MATASEFTYKGPLNLRTQNPLYLQSVNIDPTRAKTLPVGNVTVRLDEDYSNMFEHGISAQYEELLHMEILRSSLHFNAGVYDDMEVGVEIPFYRTGCCYLDAFLQDYHHAFGFPNAGREQYPNGQYDYWIKKNGATIYTKNKVGFGVGDVTLSFKHNFIEEAPGVPAIAWLFYYKLPTGSESKGTGSGNIDFGIGAAAEKGYKRIRGYLNVAYFTAGGIDPLSDHVYNNYFSYMLGGEICIARPVSIVAQIYGGTPQFKGFDMRQLDSYPMDLQFGVKGRHANNISWYAGMAEDLNANGPSIDITFLAGVGYEFAAWKK